MAAKTALIIDDEPDITTYHGTVLSDHGWEVFTANSGADGIAIAQEKAPSVIGMLHRRAVIVILPKKMKFKKQSTRPIKMSVITLNKESLLNR